MTRAGCALRHFDPLLSIEALALLTAIRISLPRRNLGPTYRSLQRLVPVVRGNNQKNLAEQEQKIWLAVQRIANHFPIKTTCLPRSLALYTMLRRRSISTELCIGIAGNSKNFRSHAWVEINGIPLGESAQVLGDFQQLPLEQLLQMGNDAIVRWTKGADMHAQSMSVNLDKLTSYKGRNDS